MEYARKGRALTGIYVPYWTFDAATRTAYQGERGEYWYETRTVMVEVNGRMEQRQEQVRHTNWYPVSGQVARDFDDVLVMASASLPQPLCRRAGALGSVGAQALCPRLPRGLHAPRAIPSRSKMATRSPATRWIR